jgi:hypothetical protein
MNYEQVVFVPLLAPVVRYFLLSFYVKEQSQYIDHLFVDLINQLSTTMALHLYVYISFALTPCIYIVSSNPVKGRCTYTRYNWLPRHNSNIVESGVKHHTPMYFRVYSCCENGTIVCCPWPWK